VAVAFPTPSRILLPGVSEADFVTIRAPESVARWVGMPLLSYVAAAQHVADLTIKMSDQQPQKICAPNPSVNRPISSSLPIIVAVVHSNVHDTRHLLHTSHSGQARAGRGLCSDYERPACSRNSGVLSWSAAGPSIALRSAQHMPNLQGLKQAAKV
jgi:hypothetical protein